ncbi:T9SS type A sorting domain-containing protein, partial [candidate division KSB1 bacterium]|nr:T9SS type A sorting domain-containing protein [candidate division KSB1 bacterium]
GMAWFENSDNGTKWQRWTITSGAASFIVPLGGADQHGLQDLNQDGLLDVAATFSEAQGELRWYANPGVTSAVDEKANAETPSVFHLAQNYPNPFNPATMIQYELPQAAQVQLAIYNLLGEKVRTLVDANEPAGIKQVTWDGRDEYGRRMSTGVYVYRLEAGDINITKRLLLMK